MLRFLSTLGALLAFTSFAISQNTTTYGNLVCSIRGLVPADGAVGIALDRTVMLHFSLPLDPGSVDASSIEFSSNSIAVPVDFELRPGNKVVIASFPSFLPADAVLDLVVRGNRLRRAPGGRVDADGDGSPGGVGRFSFTTGPGVDPPFISGPATIMGFVFEADGVTPVQDAIIEAWYFPRSEGDPPINTPPGVTLSDGSYHYETPEFVAQEDFLVRLSKPGYSESLEQVHVLAEGCWRVDALITELSPPVAVTASRGANLSDPDGRVELVLPPGALQQDSVVGITILEDAGLIRDTLPIRVVPHGLFTDVAGVFGDETNSPVTFRVPNEFNLPLGTRMPFGKIDHNTLEWIDLREAYDGPPPIPDSYLGTVVSDGNGGTVIEVQFDHFCTVCTSYCGDVPEPELADEEKNVECDAPQCGSADLKEGTMSGSSYIGIHEGLMRERIRIPGVVEHGREVELSFVYSSQTANPSATLRAEVDFNSPRQVERTSFCFEIEGLKIDAVYGFSENNTKQHATFIWDGRDGMGERLRTGSYPYAMQATSLNAESAVAVPDAFGGESIATFAENYPGLLAIPSEVVEGRVVLVNLVDSAYGAGWACGLESRLAFSSDGVLIEVTGGGGWKRYQRQVGKYQFWRGPKPGQQISRNPETGEYLLYDLFGGHRQFSSEGLLERSNDIYGRSTLFDRDGAGRLMMITTPAGFQWTFTYDGADKLAAVLDSAGRLTSFVVDGAGDLISSTGALNSTRSFSYDANHSMIEHLGPRGERFNYSYTRGRITGTASYDTDGSTQLRSRTFVPSILASDMGTALDEGRGTLAVPIPVQATRRDRVVDGRGVTLVHIANESGETLESHDGLGGVRSFTYDQYGRRSSRTDRNGVEQQYSYDDDGHLAELRQYMDGGGLYSLKTTEYVENTDDISRIVDEEGKETLFLYGNNSRIEEIRDHIGQSMLFEYQDPDWPNLPSRETSTTGAHLDFAYNAQGNISSITDYPDPTGQPNGRTRTFTYDAAGNWILLEYADGKNIGRSFDPLGRLVGSSDELQRLTTVSYMDNGACGCDTQNVMKVTLPDLSTVEHDYDGLGRHIERRDFSGVTESFTYDPEGLRSSWTNRNGDTILYEYDAARRVTTKELPGGNRTTYVYDAVGGLIEAFDDNCQVRIGRDFIGRPISSSILLDEPVRGSLTIELEHSLDASLDRVGNLLTLQDSLGYVDVSYGYDDLQRMVSVRPAGGDGWLLEYDESSRRTAIVREIPAFTTNILRDSLGKVLALSHGSSPGIAASYTGFNSAAHLTESSFEVLGQVFDMDFGYGDDRRLLSSTTGSGHGDATTGMAYTHGTGSRLTSDTEYSYTYDLAGNMLTRANLARSTHGEFSWDAEGMLQSYRQIDDSSLSLLLDVNYSYDPLGRRVSKTVNGVPERFIYWGEDIVLTLDGRNDGDLEIYHGPGVDDPLAFRDLINGETYELLRDRQFSIVGIANSSGALVEQYLYGEYGQLIEPSQPTIVQPYGFTSRELDLESGLYFYRARYYQPELGRFISEDPLGLYGGFNPYEYVESNPVNLIDPWGLSSECNDTPCGEKAFRACVNKLKEDNKEMLDASEKLHKVIGCFTLFPISCFTPGPDSGLHGDGPSGFDFFFFSCRVQATCR
ncbi:MAG: RHS repeat-associated protein [Planctomycetota bacterium]|jgi:RHS repeat-associated protein